MRKRLTVPALFLCVILIFLFTNMIDTKAYDPKSGYVNDDYVNVRTGPGTSYVNVTHSGSKIQLYTGHSVNIVNEAVGTDGMVWYNIEFVYSGSSYTGYMRSDFITISTASTGYTYNGDFEAYLTAQGFPESYKPALRELHAKYPNWVFVADKVNYNWSDVVNAESVVGRSLISYNSISSYKSLETGAYNWDTGTWNYFDGTAWAAASEELVAYCLDPRNFLNDKYIFQFETLSYQPSYHTLSGIKTLVGGTFLDSSVENTTYADIFLAAALQSGVSPYYLVASVIQEQGVSGTSGLISGTYSGYTGLYNFFNYGAYAANGNSATVNGLIYAGGTEAGILRPWNSRYRSIVGGAIKTGNGYINIGQDTIYYKKFDLIGIPYTHQYMTHILGAKNEGGIMGNAYSAAMKSSISLTFKIPVYNNMPESVSQLPTNTGSPNNVLSLLSISGYSLTPTFDRLTTSYSIIVDNSVTSINISATLADQKASLTGNGTKNISVGNNSFNVVVTAENGDKRTYTINVVRQEPSGNSQEISGGATITTDFNIDSNYITGIPVGTNVGNARNEITASGCTYKFTKADGTDNNGVLGTGNKCVIYDVSGTTKLKEYTVVIYGDVDGDGLVSSKDMLYLKRHILGISELSGAFLNAANITKTDDGVNSKDMLYLKRHILGISTITQ